MTNKEILKQVDHTLLKPFASWEDIRTLCEEAIEYQTASVCIPPAYVKRVKDAYGERLKICTVIGFPLGYSVVEAKLAEVKQAIEDGADELDMVINIAEVKNGNYTAVEDEIRRLKEAAGERVLKVIIETCYLTKEEKIRMCEVITSAKADYIKTSTGFGTGGATMEDVLLFTKHIGSAVKIKAAGGISGVADMEAFFNAGCERLGTSSAVKLIKGQAKSDY